MAFGAARIGGARSATVSRDAGGTRVLRGRTSSSDWNQSFPSGPNDLVESRVSLDMRDVKESNDPCGSTDDSSRAAAFIASRSDNRRTPVPFVRRATHSLRYSLLVSLRRWLRDLRSGGHRLALLRAALCSSHRPVVAVDGPSGEFLSGCVASTLEQELRWEETATC